MNNYLFYGLLQFLIGFTAEKIQPQEVVATTAIEKSMPPLVTYFSDDVVFKDELYTAILRVDKQQNETYQMDIQMHLKKGAYFVSPNAKGNFSGRFTLVLTENDKLQQSGAIIETPLSVEEFDNHPSPPSFRREWLLTRTLPRAYILFKSSVNEGRRSWWSWFGDGRQNPSANQSQDLSANQGQDPSANQGQDPSADQGQDPSANQGQDPSADQVQDTSAKENKETKETYFIAQHALFIAFCE